MGINGAIKEKVVLALDVDTLEEAKHFVDLLSDYVGTFKVGLQLYTAWGNEIIDYISAKNSSFFLDLKLMDIPNTVQRASENVVLRGAEFFNVHALGGVKMMKAAVLGAGKSAKKLGKKPPIVLGVTILTSISQDVLNKELKIDKNVSEYAIELAKLAKTAGLTGVVASAWEVKGIKEACGKDFKVLCPGIRPNCSAATCAADDQERIATPKETLDAGADYIVLGRAVTAANDPLEMLKKIYDEIEEN
jgi:orotidine-5'-phosphate decarboxylase